MALNLHSGLEFRLGFHLGATTLGLGLGLHLGFRLTRMPLPKGVLHCNTTIYYRIPGLLLFHVIFEGSSQGELT